MRVAVLLACVGCSYVPPKEPSSGPTDGAAVDPDTNVVQPDAAGDATPDTTPPEPCSTPSATGLLLCYQFDGNLDVLDDSGPNNLDDPQASGMTAVTRTVGAITSQAAAIGGNINARIDQNALLELAADYTIVGWIRPIDSTQAGNDGILDHNGQWAFSVENRLITCWWSRTGLQKSAVAITAQEWQVAACTISGNTGCAFRIDPTGTPTMSCRSDLTGIAPIGNSGISIGSFQAEGGVIEERFRGEIDDLRVYTRALTLQELCEIAGRNDC